MKTRRELSVEMAVNWASENNHNWHAVQEKAFIAGWEAADANPQDPSELITDLIHKRSIAFDEARDAREKLAAAEAREKKLSEEM